MGNWSVFTGADTVEMFIDSHTEFPFSFSDIQFITFTTDYSIDQIAGLQVNCPIIGKTEICCCVC